MVRVERSPATSGLFDPNVAPTHVDHVADRNTGKAATDERRKERVIDPEIERQALDRDPTTHMDSHGGNLRLARPNPWVFPGKGCGLDPQLFDEGDRHLAESSQVLSDLTTHSHDGIDDELSGSMECHLPTAGGIADRDTPPIELLVAPQDILPRASATQGEHRRVLHEKKPSWTTACDSVSQRDLAFEHLVERSQTEPLGLDDQVSNPPMDSMTVMSRRETSN